MSVIEIRTKRCSHLRPLELVELSYSNKIESVGLRKCPHYRYFTNKVMSE